MISQCLELVGCMRFEGVMPKYLRDGFVELVLTLAIIAKFTVDFDYSISVERC